MSPAAQRSAFNPVTFPSQPTVEEEPQPVAEEEVKEETHVRAGLIFLSRVLLEYTFLEEDKSVLGWD